MATNFTKLVEPIILVIDLQRANRSPIVQFSFYPFIKTLFLLEIYLILLYAIIMKEVKLLCSCLLLRVHFTESLCLTISLKP
jgi:hypothetical protein